MAVANRQALAAMALEDSLASTRHYRAMKPPGLMVVGGLDWPLVKPWRKNSTAVEPCGDLLIGQGKRAGVRSSS